MSPWSGESRPETPPHTDVPSKLVSIIHYVRSDPAPKLGTILYQPVDPGFRCEGLYYHDTGPFREVGEVPFEPNTAFVFVRDDHHVSRSRIRVSRPDFARVSLQSNFWLCDPEAALIRRAKTSER